MSNIADLRSDPLGTFMRGFREQGDVVRLGLVGPIEAYLIVHPAGVDHVLRTESQRYGKVPWHNARFRELLGAGLATSEGERWLSRRRLLQPAFHRDRIDGMADAMAAETAALAECWLRLPAGTVVDMSREMLALTLSIATRNLFGVSLGNESAGMAVHFDVGLRHTMRRIESLIAWPLTVPTPENRRYRQARSALREFASSVVERRRADRSAPANLLDILLDSRDADTGLPLTPVEIRDEVLTMLIGGHETTAMGLTWAWYLLARNPDVFEAMRAESDALLAGRAPTLADLPRLKIAGMVVDETLRLYPPAWSVTRTPRRDDVVCGRRIPRGKYVITSAWMTHRHPEFWPDPEAFRPERFRDGVPTGDLRFSYFPFGGGPRQCMGLSFALMESKIVLAMLGARFRPTAVSPIPARSDPQVTLRPRGGMPMRLAD